MEFVDFTAFLGLSVALGVGLLVGAERERRKGQGPTRNAAGIRTFAVASLLGAVGEKLGGGPLLTIVVSIVAGLALVAYLRSRGDDPGMTTELALPLTALLGGLAMRDAALAAGIGTALAVLLSLRERLHRFVHRILTERELHDALLFAAVALIVLPLASDRAIGPFDALNPRTLAQLVVLAMAISAAGYAATRLLGQRSGLAIAGLAGGFVSSTATIYVLGNRARRNPHGLPGAVAGAVLSCVATPVQMIAVLSLVQPALLQRLQWPLTLGLLAALGYGLVGVFRTVGTQEHWRGDELGSAFDPWAALGFAAVTAAVLLLSAALNTWLGSRGAMISAVLAGMVDVHAAAAAIAQQVGGEALSVDAGVRLVLIAFAANAVMKAFVAYQSAGAAYAVRIVPGLALTVAATVGAAMWSFPRVP